MEWNEILITIIQTLVTGLCSVLIPYAFMLLKKKITNDRVKYLVDVAQDVVVGSVEMVNQQMVDTYKKAGKWDNAAMKEAFEACKKNVLAMMNEEAKEAVITLHGDLEAWINTMIESYVAEINHQKKMEG